MSSRTSETRPARERWARIAAGLVRVALTLLLVVPAANWVGLTGDGTPVDFSFGALKRSDGDLSVEIKDRYNEPIGLCPPRVVVIEERRDGTLSRTEPSLDCKVARDIRENYGPDTRAVEPIPMGLHVPKPTRGERLQIDGLTTVGYAALLLGLFAFQRMLSAAAARRPFAARNVTWLRVCAACVAVYWIAAPLASRPIAAGLVDGHEVASERGLYIRAVWTENAIWWLQPAVAVFALLALAQVWRSAIRLRDDVEATI